MRRKLIVLILFTLVFTGTANAQTTETTHTFSVHDMLAMDRISGPQVSPDGKWVAFTLRKTDLEANRGRTDIWLIGSDGRGLLQLTSNPASDFSPTWAPDGKSVWFLSTRSGSSQVWRIAVNGGDAVQITDLPLDIGNYLLSPDGAHLALTMEVFPGCESVDCTQKKLDERAKNKATGMIYDKLFIRHWDTWKDGRRSHLFVMPRRTDVQRGDPVDVMKSMDADCPSKPFGGIEEVAFTSDGKSLVFTARVAGREEAWSTNFDLYLVPIDGSTAPKNLTESNKAWDTAPAFSPDGKTLAYLAMQRPGYESDRFRIVLRSWPDGETRVLTENWDRSPGSVTWSADGKTIFTTASNSGQRSLFAIDAKSGKVSTIVEKGFVGAVAIAGKRILFGMDHLQSPVELYSVKSDGKDVQPITRINAEKVAKARMGEAEQFTFKGWNDETVYCYVVKPVDFNPNKKYPVAFLIHPARRGKARSATISTIAGTRRLMPAPAMRL